MNTWLEVAVSLASIGFIVTMVFYLGKFAGERQATAKSDELTTRFLRLWEKENMENWEKKCLIGLMKRAGRRKREECRKLKNRVRFLEEKEIRRKTRRVSGEHMA